MNLMNQYFVFLGAMPLPVAPEKIEMTVGNLNKTVTLVDQGEVNIVRGMPLKEIKFDMLIPSFKYPFVNYSYGTFSTAAILANLYRMKKDAKPFSFIVTRCRKNKPAQWTALKVTLEDYEIIEDANNGTDVIVSITLKQYKTYSTKKATVTKNSDGSVTAKFVDSRAVYVSDVVGTAINEGKGAAVKKVVVDAGTTLYNTMKTKLGTGATEVLTKLKSLNGNISNVIEAPMEIKMPYFDASSLWGLPEDTIKVQSGKAYFDPSTLYGG